jgi:hypothetical protein
MEGLVGVGIPLESPKLALFQRKGGFLLSERWLSQNGTVAFFARIMHGGCQRRNSDNKPHKGLNRLRLVKTVPCVEKKLML